MAIIVSGIRLSFEAPQEEAFQQALRQLKNPQARRIFLVKRSVDARHRDRIVFVYSVGVELAEGEQALVEALGDARVSYRGATELQWNATGTTPLANPPIVVGLGPAGLFAGLLLARSGYQPVILERGGPVEERVKRVARFWEQGTLDPACNVQFGEGGAGTFSDGKLTTRIGDSRTQYVLEELVAHGAPPEICWQAKPHVGTDLLRQVVTAIRREIQELGGQVLFHTRLTGLNFACGVLKGIDTTAGEMPAQAVVLAPGHSARDTFSMLLEAGAALAPKPFSVGVRIEHLQREIDKGLYGELAGHPLLPKGEYQLSHRRDGRGVYTFCMCPGGVVVPASSHEGGVVTNGMSWHARDEENANAALVVSVDERDFGAGVLDGVRFQERLERKAFEAGGGGYAAPGQTVGRFLDERAGMDLNRIVPSYARGVVPGDLRSLLPQIVGSMLAEGLRAFERKLPGFSAPDSVLTGLETRTSSPLRILRGDSLECQGMPGIYPCGEGAGYAGGIMSAAVDGIRVAQAIMERYACKSSSMNQKGD